MFNFNRQQIIAALTLAAVIIFGAGYQYARWHSNNFTSSTSKNTTVLRSSSQIPGNQNGEITVHVAGAVERPGLVTINRGARVAEAVQKAGPLPEADLNALNLAAIASDGQKIVVPARTTAPPGGTAATGSAASGSQNKPSTASTARVSGLGPTAASFSPSSLININTADTQQLASLPGIGPKLAEKIIAYRTEHGPFTTPADIQKVPGIGSSKYNQLKDLITVY